MSNYNWKTKKEIIIENASRDPFLKIDELSKLADTTSRYVRTILSEADLSLMKLRKDYVQKIESNKYQPEERLFLNRLIEVPFKSSNKILNTDGMLFNNPRDINQLGGNIHQRYLFRVYCHLFKNKPWCLSSVFLLKEGIGSAEKKASIKDLTAILSLLLRGEDIIISDLEFKIEPAAGEIARYLEITSLSPVLQARQFIKKSDDYYALILMYFNTGLISLSFSYKNQLIIKRKNISG